MEREGANGHPAKALHPTLEPTVVGGGILNREGAINDPNALLGVDGPMGNARGAGKRLIDASAVRAKNGILVNQWAQHGSDMVCV